MNPITWATNDDGTILFTSLTAEYLTGALELARKAIYPHEITCVAVGVPECEGSMDELDKFLTRIAEDGVSIVAVESKSRKVICAAFNKIQMNGGSKELQFFQNFAATCKYEASKHILDIMIYADEQCNLFEHCKIDCSMELVFLGTLPEFRHKAVAKKVCEISTEVATNLLKGIDVRVSLDSSERLRQEPKPKIISAIFTSPYSKKIGRSLNWDIAAIVEIEKCMVNGKPLTGIPDYTLEYKKLE